MTKMHGTIEKLSRAFLRKLNDGHDLGPDHLFEAFAGFLKRIGLKPEIRSALIADAREAVREYKTEMHRRDRVFTEKIWLEAA